MKCYLDMDGLLANLFDTVSRKIHKKPYLENTARDKMFIRMLWENKAEFISRIGGIEKLFANLDPYPTNTILLDKVVSHFGGFYLCSHPAKLDREGCIRGKLEWINKHIVGKYGSHLLGVHFPANKEEFALGEDGTPNLLIDDFKPYIEAWRSRGGVAIRVRTDKFSSKNEFRQFIDQQFKDIGLVGQRRLPKRKAVPEKKTQARRRREGVTADG
jgi:hypothetical protein